jgi:hypothetical protein
MDNNDKSRFLKVLNGMAAMKSKQLSNEAILLWWAALKDKWDIDDFEDAAAILITECQFMPSPYEFEQLRKANQTSKHEAWAIALAHCEGGWRRNPSCGYPLIDQAIANLGGYQTIALKPQDQLSFIERRFADIYEDMSATNDVRAALPNLSTDTKLLD